MASDDELQSERDLNNSFLFALTYFSFYDDGQSADYNFQKTSRKVKIMVILKNMHIQSFTWIQACKSNKPRKFADVGNNQHERFKERITKSRLW